MKVVWRSVAMEFGELCVMTFGVHQMLKLSADSSDFQILVSIASQQHDQFKICQFS